MKYAFPQLKHPSRFLTYGVVKHALEKRGHEVIPDLDDDVDAVLYSACDVMDMRELRSLRKSTSRPIIVGGHYAYNFWSAIIYSDIVWLGEIYEFAELSNISEIANSEHAYVDGKNWNDIVPATTILWDEVPVVQQHKDSAYYWGGSGCKNKCRFCFTSWTHPHQQNSDGNIVRAQQIARKNKVYLMIVSNEYDTEQSMQTKDMMVRDYLKIHVQGGFVRLGIEFATEATRKRFGKNITDDDIYAMFQKAEAENVSLRLFHIGGYEGISEWDKYFDRMSSMLTKVPNHRLINFRFTNIQYQNYTPLYLERRNIDASRYITGADTKRWFDKLRLNTNSVLIGRPSPFQHVVYRMGLELSRTKEQAEFFLSLYARRLKIAPDVMYNALFDTGIMDTPYVRMMKNRVCVMDVEKKQITED